MRFTQENQFNMFKMVQGVCERHKDTWSTLPAFVASQELFAANLETIKQHIATQNTVITGGTDEKNATKEVMQKNALVIANAVFAYADKNQHLDLMAKMKLTSSSMAKGKNSEVVQRCQNIKNEAEKVLADLSDYGIDETDLTKLQSDIDEYKELEKTPRLNIIDRKAATAGIGKLIAANRRILKNQMDKLIYQFESSNPVLFRDYFNAREIIDMKSSATSKGQAEGLEDDPDPNPPDIDMGDAA